MTNLKHHCLTQDHEAPFSCNFLDVLVLGFTFSSVIYFYLILYVVSGKGLSIIINYLLLGIPILKALLLKINLP